jgi:hypothetical protein
MCCHFPTWPCRYPVGLRSCLAIVARAHLGNVGIHYAYRFARGLKCDSQWWCYGLRCMRRSADAPASASTSTSCEQPPPPTRHEDHQYGGLRQPGPAA